METNGQMTLAGQMNIYDCIAEAERAAESNPRTPREPEPQVVNPEPLFGGIDSRERDLIRERPDRELSERPA